MSNTLNQSLHGSTDVSRNTTTIEDELPESKVNIRLQFPKKRESKRRLYGCFRKLQSISIAKKSTGALYINGQDTYTTVGDIICSLIVILVIVVTLLFNAHELNEIISF